VADRPRLHVGPSPDQDPFDEIEREEPVLDQAGRGLEAVSQRGRITDFTGEVRNDPTVGTRRNAAYGGRRQPSQSGCESEGEQLQGIGW